LSLRYQIVIAVNALDKCNDNGDIVAIHRLMALGATALGSSRLQVLLIIRPKTPVRFRIQAITLASYDCLVLHNFNPRYVDCNISAYLADFVRCVSSVFFHDLDWPGAETVERLVTQACGLFIWAATAYQFISRGGLRAQDRLRDIFSGVCHESTPKKSLDGIPHSSRKGYS
jgi:hypothetical protein